MKRLLGIINNKGKEQLLVSSGSFVGLIDSSQSKDFKAYLWQKGLNKTGQVQDELFNFRLGPSSGALLESVIFNIFTYGERMKEVYIDNTYKSRSIEQKMRAKCPFEALKLSEQICASFAFSHSCAFSRAIEEAFNINISDNVKIMRLVLLEVERIFNHIYVISRLSGAAAQKVLTNHLIYLFDEILSLNKTFFGSRFLKNINTIGSIKYIPKAQMEIFSKKLESIVNEFSKLYEFSLKSHNYLDRLYNTGILTMDDFEMFNFDGPALKAINISLDTRVYEDFFDNFKSVIEEDGDALSRMIVRAKEVFQSMRLIKQLIEKLKEDVPNSNIVIEDDQKEKNSIAFAESPSGTIYYYIELIGNKIDYVYIAAPSMFLIKAIEKSLEGQIFTDFAFTVDSFGAFFADAAK
ncbi:Formate hydrogenlyase subunit 5 [Desulfurella amilsii]|uniref:Formate hydrogenlyase subunit 5 n=1 Tax=Desulfurella amilsii TaxID=1562698 RepID=A0A1X4XVB0_9BACT|nr:Ni,Fe-hydrogenase III large subunit [Desulfurella amilsii]OSS41465.1 Formate hydrogenlyase subunit 5 [Desulfurella amilsii]